MRIPSLVYKTALYAFLGAALLGGPAGFLLPPAGALPGTESTNIYTNGLATDEEPAFSAEAEALVSMIESYLRAQDYASAGETALLLTQLYPTYAKGWLLLGYCRSMTLDFTGSNDAYGKAMELGAERNAVLSTQAYAFMRMGEYEEARTRCRSILESNPSDLEALKQLGFIEAELGKFDAAVLIYEKAMELAPADASVVLALAKVEASLGHDGQKQELLEKGLLLEPGNTEMLGMLGQLYIKEKNYKAALDPLKRLAAVEPGNAKAYRNLGVAYYQLDEKENALGAIERARQLGGDMGDLLGPLADCYLETGKRSEALAVIQEGIGKGAQRSWLFFLWGNALEDSKDYDGAIEKFSEAVRAGESPWSDYANRQIARQSTHKKREGMMASQMQE